MTRHLKLAFRKDKYDQFIDLPPPGPRFPPMKSEVSSNLLGTHFDDHFLHPNVEILRTVMRNMLRPARFYPRILRKSLNYFFVA